MEVPAALFSFQLLSFFLIVLHLSSFSVPMELGSFLPNCSKTCGNVEISYPFGVGDGCFFQGFEVICNKSIPFLAGSDLQLVEILQGEVRVKAKPFLVTSCKPHGNMVTEINLLQDSPYTISISSNRFIIIGCSTGGAVTDANATLSSCTSVCYTRDSMDDGSCTGQGCCQTTLPRVQKHKVLTTFLIGVNKNLTSPCSYGVIVENGSYIFRKSDAWDFNLSENVTTKLEWAIGDHHEKLRNKNVSICGQNSIDYDSKRFPGDYLCRCSPGYEGNPYIKGSGGCQRNKEHNPCVPEATCQNTNLGYRCSCSTWNVGDGYRMGSGCHRFKGIQLLLGSMVSIPIMITALSWFYLAKKNRQLTKMRAKYFHQNGGLLLQQHVFSGKGTCSNQTKIFSARELEKATNNYDISRVLGRGGQGTVYKGILEGGYTVAIKKSQLIAQCQVDQFINELVILTQINHKHIVKLIGFCLETQVPLLVYEFIPGGTLYQKLHGYLDDVLTRLSWNDRLRIATEIGEALSYLHSYACMPIFHRDVKSSNILLDWNNTAKLSDFGISRLVPLDKNRVSTAVHGTIGYLDPEYFSTGKLTEKSDVYSFGVVLLELLTGRRPVQHEETRDYSSLVMHFKSCVGRGNLLQVLDKMVLEEAKMEEVRAIAGVASRCLTVLGARRPTMKKVARKLASMR
ncbi:hypothetical protein HHK36_020692 [Tetracentron sinense]|uniref:Protein kinase domain-containing protein n=1 Tax=Tetracentron sinense TaxID=13715 RepID=A0A834YS59_TETSI|nr:hypothetical protein HHK36_020692 [Tetracentron sinense]